MVAAAVPGFRCPDLPSSLRLGVHVLDSTPLTTLSGVSFKNFLHMVASISEKSLGKVILDGVVQRGRYVESFGTACFSVIHNTILATASSVAVLGTFGQVSDLNEAAKRFWIHTALAVASVAVSVLGVIFPRLGVGVNLLLILGLAFMFAKKGLSGAGGCIKDLYMMNKDVIRAEIAKYSRPEDRLQVTLVSEAIFQVVDERIQQHRLNSFQDFTELLGGLGQVFRGRRA